MRSWACASLSATMTLRATRQLSPSAGRPASAQAGIYTRQCAATALPGMLLPEMMPQPRCPATRAVGELRFDTDIEIGGPGFLNGLGLWRGAGAPRSACRGRAPG